MVPETSLWKTIVTLQKAKLGLCVILLLLLSPVYSDSCPTTNPRPGKCANASSPYEHDTTVFPSTAASCDFSGDGEHSLCCYRQGCRDRDMSNWTAANGSANATQPSAGCGQSYAYSILESPWLNFSTVSCVQFDFSKEAPYDLNVFFAVRGAETETVMTNLGDSRHIGQFTVLSLIGKILFRAYGGGSHPTAGFKLYNVSIQQSACSDEGVLVISTISPSSSGTWTPAILPLPTSASGGDGFVNSTTLLLSCLEPTITSPPTTSGAAQPSGGNSLNNDMADDSHGEATVVGTVIAVVAVIAVIAVVVVVVIWKRRRPKSSTGGHKKDTENDISTLKTGNVGGVATRKAEGNDGNDYTAIRKSHFALASPSPEEDYVEIDDVTSPTKIESRDADVRAHDTAKIRTRDEADIKRYDVPKVTTRDADNTPYDPAKIRNRDDADIKHYDVPRVTTRDTDNTPYDPAKITTHDDDIDPYDHAEDGAPGKGRNSGGHDHKRFQLHDAPHQKPFPSEKVVDGDYSEIDGPQDITRSDVSDSYSRVQKTNKKPGSPDPKDDYSVANKKGKKPEVAAKFEQPEGDYNRIRLAGSQPVASNTPRDAPSDPYNRIGKVSSRDDVGNGGESTKAEGDQVQDDYNTLSFDEARKMSAKTTERETTHKAYDRVQTDPYSKAQVGKRKVVIDSDYDHVEK